MVKQLEEKTIELFKEVLQQELYKNAIELIRTYKNLEYDTKPLQDIYNQKIKET